MPQKFGVDANPFFKGDDMKKIHLGCMVLLFAWVSLAWGQISLTGTNFSTMVPKNNQEAFSKYFTGGFLTSGSYYQFLNPGKGISHIEAASLTGLHYSWHGFGKQTKPAALPVITAGLLDNVAVVQGAVNSDMKSSYLIDIASLGANYTLPIFKYAAYLNVGAKVGATYNSSWGDSISALNTKFVFVKEFRQENGQLKAELNDKSYYGVNAEAALKAGVRVYTNWFVTLSLGMRMSKQQEGRWFNQSDVSQWINDPDLAFTPQELYDFFYWDDKSLPENNYLISGTSYFLHLGISPFF